MSYDITLRDNGTDPFDLNLAAYIPSSAGDYARSRRRGRIRAAFAVTTVDPPADGILIDESGNYISTEDGSLVLWV